MSRLSECIPCVGGELDFGCKNHERFATSCKTSKGGLKREHEATFPFLLWCFVIEMIEMMNDQCWGKDILTSIQNRQPAVIASVRPPLISSHPACVQFLFVIKRIAAHLLHLLCVASQAEFQQVFFTWHDNSDMISYGTSPKWLWICHGTCSSDKALYLSVVWQQRDTRDSNGTKGGLKYTKWLKVERKVAVFPLP